MNITISKKICKSQEHIKENWKQKNKHLLSEENQQSHKKINRPHVVTEPSQMDMCSKWFFQKCLKESKRYENNQLKDNKCSHLRLTGEVHKNLNLKQSDKESLKKGRERKIYVFSNPKKESYFNNDNLQKLRLKLENTNKIHLLSKDVLRGSLKDEQKYDMLQTKQCTGVNPSMVNSGISSLSKIKDSMTPEILNRPSTFISSHHSSQNKQLKHKQIEINFPNYFKLGRTPENKQNEQLMNNQQYQENKKKQNEKQLNEQVKSIIDNEDDLKNSFQNYNIIGQSFSNVSNMVNNSQSANKSIDTEHLKRKIDFSEIKPNKISVVRSLQENLLSKKDKKQEVIKSPQKQSNKQSKFIHSIKISHESDMNSRYLNLQESFVLQKGLIEIFSHSLQRNEKIKKQQLLNQKFQKSKLLNKLTEEQNEKWKYLYLHSNQKPQKSQVIG